MDSIQDILDDSPTLKAVPRDQFGGGWPFPGYDERTMTRDMGMEDLCQFKGMYNAREEKVVS